MLETVVMVVVVTGTIGRMGAPIMGVKQLQSLVTDVMRALSFFPIRKLKGTCSILVDTQSAEQLSKLFRRRE